MSSQGLHLYLVPNATCCSIHFDNIWNSPQNSLILPYQSHMAGKLREIDRKYSIWICIFQGPLYGKISS
jgi:hypothetical protein